MEAIELVFFRHTTAKLEQQFSAELELPVEYVGALYPAEVRAVEVGHGRRELRAIEEVETFGAQLQANVFGDSRRLEQRQIKGVPARRAHV